MDKLKAMQTFVRIADEGSLTAAARELGTSLPAVVRSLAALEGQLGTRLFHRTTRRISLTEEGRDYLERCRHVLAAVDEAEAALKSEAAEPSGRITLTAPVMFGQLHVAPAVTRFVQQHDKVGVNLLLFDRIVDLVDEGIDLAVRIGRLDDSSLVALPLGSVQHRVVASPAFLKRHGLPKHPKDLAGLDCIRTLNSGPVWAFQDSGRPLKVSVDGPLAFNHVAPAIEACVAGIGVGMFISYQVAPHLQRKALRVILDDFATPAQPVHLVYPHARLMPARTRALIDWLRAELKTLQR